VTPTGQPGPRVTPTGQAIPTPRTTQS
jgi:hypothetical protein